MPKFKIRNQSSRDAALLTSPKRATAASLSIVIAILLFALTACQTTLLEPPRLATQEAQAAAPPTATATPVLVQAPTPTADPLPAPPTPINQANPNPAITLWVNQTSDDHRIALEQLAEKMEADINLHLEFIMIDDTRLPDLVETAALSGTLPDLIIHSLDLSHGWAERGITDETQSSQLISQLGRDTFDGAALDLLTDANGLQVGLPIHGWQNLLIYRADWFDSLNTAAPVSFSDIISGAQKVYRSDELSAQTGISNTLISGLVVPTESNLINTHRVFEQIALANGCELIDTKGEVTFTSPECLDALDFYRQLVNRYSPSDIQTDISALNAYLAGRTSMIVTSPRVLVQLADLDEVYRPSCPECDGNRRYLVENSGIVTQITGRSAAAQPASFSEITVLAITRDANPEQAALFTDYWFNEGYVAWLAVEPESKFPLRNGTASNMTQFIDAWQQLPVGNGTQTLTEIYGSESVAQITTDLTAAPRWGIPQGQGALISDLSESYLFSIILQEMLSGYFTTNQAVIEAYERVVDLIPNYAYYIEPTEVPAQNNDASDG